jgi:hypothetical protein
MQRLGLQGGAVDLVGGPLVTWGMPLEGRDPLTPASSSLSAFCTVM